MSSTDDDSLRAPETGTSDVVDNITRRRKRFELYQSDSHKMKSLMMNSAGIRSELSTGNERAPNPLWTTFPTTCVKPITSVAEMKEKLEYFSKSDDVLVVRYHQNNCTACNAVGKVFEVLCHQSAIRTPGLKFYDVNRDAVPELAVGLVRFPQIKGYSGGQWTDIDFKPPTAFREELYAAIETEVRRLKNQGRPVTALQTEEMYFSGAGPAMLEITEEQLMQFYCKAQVRLHNYWKQVSLRRTWFYRKFIEPEVEERVMDEWRMRSIFGEKVVYGPQPADDFA
ncbi:cytochrome c oxidase assembly protein [Novymonas esmeraldas]|uniref:Cytochrome c oxidase assembly protein n=1 Tax=Novymonas esmeraldas TaxID=1808958 RepID=A0AAW0EM86_9TRYP